MPSSPPTEETNAIAPKPRVRADAPIPLFDRELSWLEFNRRVLGEAQSADVPLLERLKFLSIASNNLDEFLMIRVGEVRDVLAANLGDATTAAQQREKLSAIRERTTLLLEDMYRCLNVEILPALRKHGARIERVEALSKRDRQTIDDYFTRNLEPILTPLAIDPGHPFPFLANLALTLLLQLESPRGERHTVIVKIPQSSPRVVPLGDTRFVLIEDIVVSYIHRFFPGQRLRKSFAFRVIRNSDISIKEEDVQDLLKSIETELRRRDRREVVWLEIEAGADERLLDALVTSMGSAREDVYFAPGPLKLSDLMQLYRETPDASLKDAAFNPRIPAQLASSDDIFSIIRRGDILLHRPYDSFTAVVEFVQAAAEDPDVVAIKQTLYRTDPGSPIIEALANAAERGKQVTAVVELQARFDEQKNITWARHLEEAGVQVVYGIVGIKTHCKLCLIVRREGGALRRYVHLSTGNYNAVTARHYTDLDLFTCDEDFGVDAAQVMNLLTGFSVAGVQELLDTPGSTLPWRKFVVAPMDYHHWVLSMIERETANARGGKPARITAKMNALVDAGIVAALYRASAAGVQIDLVVRGICCLVPQLPGFSENIRVTSVIDRFLEHSRVFRFENAGAPEFYITSGDWMPRNFIRRIEITFPLLAEPLRKRIAEQILPLAQADNVKAWTLEPDGTYQRRRGGEPIRSQEAFIAIARAEAVRLGPYEEMIRRPGTFRRKAKRKKHKRSTE